MDMNDLASTHSSRTVQLLNERFRAGRPSHSLTAAGIVARAFDSAQLRRATCSAEQPRRARADLVEPAAGGGDPRARWRRWYGRRVRDLRAAPTVHGPLHDEEGGGRARQLHPARLPITHRRRPQEHRAARQGPRGRACEGGSPPSPPTQRFQAAQDHQLLVPARELPCQLPIDAGREGAADEPRARAVHAALHLQGARPATAATSATGAARWFLVLAFN